MASKRSFGRREEEALSLCPKGRTRVLPFSIREIGSAMIGWLNNRF